MKEYIKKNYDLVICTVASFLILFLYGGLNAQMYNDSQGYLNMSPERSPLYPMFLKMCELVFAHNQLKLVVVIQTLFAIYSVSHLHRVIKDIFECNKLLSFMIYPFLLVPYVLEALISGGRPYNNAVLTEGLAYPLFYIYFALLLETLLLKEDKSRLGNLIWMYILSGVLILLRGQMQLTLIINVLLSVFIIWENRKAAWLKSIMTLVSGVAVSMLIVKAVTYIYTYNMYGEYIKPEFGNTSYMINFLYVADKKDIETFRNHKDAEFINDFLDDWESSKWSYDYRGDSIGERANHLMDANLYLKLHSYTTKAEEYYGNKGLKDTEIYQKYEAVAKDMLDELAPKHIDRWIEGVFTLFVWGIPDAVFFKFTAVRTLCFVVAFALIVIVVVLSLILLIKKHDSKSGRLMIAMIIMLLGNLAACSLVIGPVFRYLAYFWGLFYISGLLLLEELYDVIRGKKNGEEGREN